MTVDEKPDDNFDPWTATESDAISCCARAITREGLAYGLHETNPLFQWTTAQTLLLLKDRDSLSPTEVLTAIDKCLVFKLVVPDWILVKFNEYVLRITSLNAGSWEEVFGAPLFPKGTRVATMRRKRDLSKEVLKSVVRALSISPKRPIDKGLFEEVGAQHGIGATLAEECYALGKGSHESPRDLLDRLHERRSFLYVENTDGTHEISHFDFFGNPVK